jgi:hypothetical protein
MDICEVIFKIEEKCYEKRVMDREGEEKDRGSVHVEK